MAAENGTTFRSEYYLIGFQFLFFGKCLNQVYSIGFIGTLCVNDRTVETVA